MQTQMEPDNMKLLLEKEMEKSLSHLMTERKFRRGDTIQDNNALRTKSLFIKKGMARAYYILKGREHTYTFSVENEIIMIPVSLFRIPDSIQAIEFLEDTEILEFSHADIKTAIINFSKEHIAEVASAIISRIIAHTQTIEERMLVFQSMGAEERYQWFKGMYPRILERANITQIASFLGVTKETLYRIRSGKY